MNLSLSVRFAHPGKNQGMNASRPWYSKKNGADGARRAGVVNWLAGKKIRREAYFRTRDELAKEEYQGFHPRDYTITWYYKGNKPDADNVASRCKRLLDGMAEAFGVNDRDFEFLGVRRVKDWDKAGTVEITFFHDTEQLL